MSQTNGESSKPLLLQALELNQIQQAIVQPTPWTQARPEQLLTVRKSDLEWFLSRIVVNQDVNRLAPASEIVRKIQRVVAAAFFIDVTELLSGSRARRFCWPRQVAVYLVRTHSPLSLGEISIAFNFADHGTVCHCIAKVKDQIATDPRAADAIAELSNQVRQALKTP